MATRDVAGRRYALAVMEIARSEGAIDSWLEAVEALGALSANSRHVDMLQADGMTDAKFATIVRQVLPAITEKQLNLFRLLRRKSRLGLGPSIADYFRELVDEERGVVRAVVTTAVELDEERRRQVQQQLEQATGRRVVLDVQTDPAILGGMVLRIGDEMLDGSTRTRLRSLRSQLERAAS
ncbi:MAG: ATP synthase F1 subunit delta [Chloroflexi bacterium HGW-Chloroflexi-9]|nr:ATP synthase F1 subunit delta [Dehalococcoidia bacterium]PKN81991.1 MAG: ATP synthase F1 subunit delta [Chloroflexi bacterium HGW-Chloroflexi-9]